MASGAEKSYAHPAHRTSPPFHWLMVPGWRVVFGTGDPQAPAQEAAEVLAERGDEAGADFYRTLADTYATGGRDAAMEFLVADRKRKIRAGSLRGMRID